MQNLQTSIELTQMVSQPLMVMVNAMNTAITNFQALDAVSENVLDTFDIGNVKTELDRAGAEIAQFQEQMSRLSQDKVKIAEPIWNGIQPVEVYNSDSFTRLKEEVQAAGTLMEQLQQKQQVIDSQAISMHLLPGQAQSDILQTNQRIDELTEKLAQLESMDVTLMDDTSLEYLNREYEGIRSELAAALKLQNDMNQAIDQGNISRLNQGYEQLNQLTGQVERNIRDNLSALEQMNQFDWTSSNHFESIDTSGIERMHLEMDQLQVSLESLLRSQAKISTAVLDMEILPQSAVWDINLVNEKIGEMGERLNQLQSIDTAYLDVDSIERLNNEYESVRREIAQAVQLQEGMNDALKAGDLERLNTGYNALNDIADRVSHKVRENVELFQTASQFEWRQPDRMVFETSGLERLVQEMASLESMTNRIQKAQDEITQRAMQINILPPEAKDEIVQTDLLIFRLSERLNTLQGMDTTLLSSESIEAVNRECEVLRSGMSQITSIQNEINSAIESNDFSSLNQGYNELHQIAEQVSMKVRENTQAIQEMTSIEWTSPNVEVFTTSGVERYNAEINATMNTMSRLTDIQRQVQAQANQTNLFPSNMVSDINQVTNRITNLQTEIERIQSNPINAVCADAVNDQVEQLRSQLNQAIDEQENLNQAMADMDISAANEAYARLNGIIDNTDRYIRDNINEQGRFNNALMEGTQNAASMGDKIKQMAKAYLGIAAVRSTANWVQESIDLSNVQRDAERQLNVVLRNVGAADDAFQQLKETAASIQGYTNFGDESMLGGAAELATYINDAEAIQAMMGTLANYATGMSGGGEVAYQQMVDYATQLGKALDGTYDGLTKKGFELSDVQKEIIENGTDMEKALVLDEVISQSWANLAQNMVDPIIQTKNAFGDVQEEVGARLYPAILSIWDTINENMPQIETILMGFASGIEVIVFVLNSLLDVIFTVGAFVADNWSIIAPIILAIVGAFVAYNAILVIHNGILAATAAWKQIMVLKEAAHQASLAMTAGATFSATAAQYGLNAALLACPLTWIIIAIVAVIAILYAVVGALNKFAGTSISATGIVCGVFMVAAAFIGNLIFALINTVIGIFIVLWNFIASFVNFFANVFTDPVGSIARLFFDLVDTILSLLETLAKAIDTIFGSNLSGAVNGWRSNLSGWVDDTFGKGEEIMAKVSIDDYALDRFEYSSAWDAGYNFGAGLDDKISDFDTSSLFDTYVPDPSDYIGDYDDSLGSMGSDVGGIADDTSAIKDTVTASNKELKYLREIAERQAINKFTTAEVNLEIKTEAVINQDTDLDGFVDLMAAKLGDELLACAEGAHI